MSKLHFKLKIDDILIYNDAIRRGFNVSNYISICVMGKFVTVCRNSLSMERKLVWI
tara:strand:+ start:3132 stop:3299 length:168 start_codon:yes stop_codon:yes gene_type:complete